MHWGALGTASVAQRLARVGGRPADEGEAARRDRGGFLQQPTLRREGPAALAPAAFVARDARRAWHRIDHRGAVPPSSGGRSVVGETRPAADGGIAPCLHPQQSGGRAREPRGRPRVLVPYERLIADWRSFAARLRELTGLRLPAPSAAAAAEIDNFLTTDLHHDKFSRETLAAEPEVAAVIVEIYDRMVEAAAQGDDTVLQRPFDRLRETVAEATKLYRDSCSPSGSGAARKSTISAASRTPSRRSCARISALARSRSSASKASLPVCGSASSASRSPRTHNRRAAGADASKLRARNSVSAKRGERRPSPQLAGMKGRSDNRARSKVAPSGDNCSDGTPGADQDNLN